MLLLPISLFCQPQEPPSPEDLEAADILLGLSSSSRVDNNMLVDLWAQSPVQICHPGNPQSPAEYMCPVE